MQVVNTVLVLCALAYLEVKAGPTWYRGENEIDRPDNSYRQNFNGEDFCIGTPSWNERLLYQTIVRHKGIRLDVSQGSSPYVRFGFFGKRTVDIDLPMNSGSIGGTISRIEGLNRARCEGSVWVTRGGVGFQYVTLHFEFSYWQDVNFDIKVYGCYRGYC